MPQRFYSIFYLVVLSYASAQAQNLPYPTYEGDGDRLTRLLLAASDSSELHLSMGSVTYNDVADAVESIEETPSAALKAAVYSAEARLGNLPRRSVADRGWIGRTFYTRPGHALDLERPGFRLFVSPVLDFRIGNQTNSKLDEGGLVLYNSRGVTLRGQIDDRVYFQTTILENQVRLSSWAREWSASYGERVPGVGFRKNYSLPLFEATDGYDYIQSTGELGLRLSRHISLILGHGNPRSGTGYRSLVLDDLVDPYLYAQIDTRVWRIHYRNTFAQLQDGIQASNRVSRKYLAAHTLSIRLTPNWELSITEQTVLQRDNGAFDLQYLNPVILYRAVEHDNGSPDNALFSIQSNVRLGTRALVYGQLLLDEFNADRLFGGEGWWANKYAWQIGVRTFGLAGVDDLELGAEYNLVRPFTYGHRFGGIDYTHYGQLLAHPWGGSLREAQLRVGYQMGRAWRIDARAIALTQDDLSQPSPPHIGANPTLNNNERGHLDPAIEDDDFGYSVAGEAPIDRYYGRVQVGYSPFPGAQAQLRYELYGRNGPNQRGAVQHGVTLGLRLNAARRSSLF